MENVVWSSKSIFKIKVLKKRILENKYEVLVAETVFKKINGHLLYPFLI